MRRRTATVGTAAVALVGVIVVWLVTARLFPYHSLNHDEGVYLQQAAMLLEGRLFLRPPVEGVFRPWFFVESADGLYPKYAPVPAAMFALGELVGSYRVALLAIAAGNLALTAGVVREAFARRTALVAAVCLLASPLFVLNSAVFLPYAPTHLLNLAFAYSYLRADRTGDRRWAAAAGGAVGLAFFSRPFTALLFATPFVAHALWTLRRNVRENLPRQATTAVLGLVGVAVTLAYNAVVTGSPLLFPYEAFAPLDGLGFGERRILDHGIDYSPTLALRANGRVLWLFFSQWAVGGLVGAAAAAVGLAVAVRRGLSPRQATVGGLFLTVSLGNVYFWGNFNVLGDLETAGDGLVAALGPYYHFDLLLPTATFAAVGAVAVVEFVRDAAAARDGFDPRATRAAVVVTVLLLAGVAGAVTVDAASAPVERNAEVTETYQTAYEPFEGGPPANSLVFLPDPYGDWLNHPFQLLRNDPGFDGDAVYAIDDRPFETVDTYPDRQLYRYAYRGEWAPFAGSPRAARLQRIESVRGEQVILDATVGAPQDAQSVTVRVGDGDESVYAVGNRTDGSLRFRLLASDGHVALTGPDAKSSETLSLSGRETIRASVFVDYGPGGSFTYRFELPLDAADGTVRGLSPRVELCRGVRSCGGAATYVPESAPDGVFVETNLTADEHNP
ncbi:ArnT family glycosyltransferase [Halosimplex salinum]|uniref:ArnT family glycosyltransferase n=1 Tax=Halosimplex salinum TaxID=1710538 RepID=UPI000F48EDA8|nr:glycosyltransferase family 39 protein [Halosimplex salinum]